MKRLFLLCAAAFAVVSCARDEALVPDSGTETVYSIEARLGQATRVALDGTKPEWTLEDTLAVYTGSGYSWHHFKPREGAPLGCFFGFQEPRSIPGATFNMATVGALNPMLPGSAQRLYTTSLPSLMRTVTATGYPVFLISLGICCTLTIACGILCQFSQFVASSRTAYSSPHTSHWYFCIVFTIAPPFLRRSCTTASYWFGRMTQTHPATVPGLNSTR